VEIAHDLTEMADSPGIESGGKVRPLKGVNWQRREEVFRAGRGGALCHVQITDCGHPFFQHWITGIEIFIDDHFPFNNEFRTRQRISHRALVQLSVTGGGEHLIQIVLITGVMLSRRERVCSMEMSMSEIEHIMSKEFVSSGVYDRYLMDYLLNCF
jgi:hypothetical protein